MLYRFGYVREISPGTHTFFPAYTCLIYCWHSVQLSDFGLFGDLVHASQPDEIPVRQVSGLPTASSGPLLTETPLLFSYILPTAGRIRDFHPLERALTGRTR